MAHNRWRLLQIRAFILLPWKVELLSGHNFISFCVEWYNPAAIKKLTHLVLYSGGMIWYDHGLLGCKLKFKPEYIDWYFLPLAIIHLISPRQYITYRWSLTLTLSSDSLAALRYRIRQRRDKQNINKTQSSENNYSNHRMRMLWMNATQ